MPGEYQALIPMPALRSLSYSDRNASEFGSPARRLMASASVCGVVVASVVLVLGLYQYNLLLLHIVEREPYIMR